MSKKQIFILACIFGTEYKNGSGMSAGEYIHRHGDKISEKIVRELCSNGIIVEIKQYTGYTAYGRTRF